MEELTEEEKTVCRRGRNAKSGSMAKNATMKEYRMATGFEAWWDIFIWRSGLTGSQRW